jgi:dienelactone hydrolase
MLKLCFKIFLVLCCLVSGITYSQDLRITEKNIPVIFYPSSDKEINYGTVIVAHGCAGVMLHERNVGQKFANKNFNTVVVDSWAYRGYPAGVGEGSICKRRFDPSLRLEEIFKTAEWIKQQPWHKGKVFLVGYSQGAMTALEAGLYPPSKGIDKAVAFYPYCHPHYHRDPSIPTQIHIGTDDDWTPARLCHGIYEGWFKKYKNGEYYEYPNTTHSFDIGRDFTVRGMGNGGLITDRVIKFNRESTDLAYDRTISFFKE